MSGKTDSELDVVLSKEHGMTAKVHYSSLGRHSGPRRALGKQHGDGFSSQEALRGSRNITKLDDIFSLAGLVDKSGELRSGQIRNRQKMSGGGE